MAHSPHSAKDQQGAIWHALTIDEVMSRAASSEEGLNSEEAQERLRRYGANQLPPPPRRSALARFFMQFHNMLIYVLLAAAVVTALVADWLDAAVILGVVVINAVIGFVQEGKAEKAVDAIRGILTHEAMVLRDGRKVAVKAQDLVPGDIVYLQSGDKVPADLRLIKVKDLRIEEAALTGESVPSEKSTEPVAANASLGDRADMAFSGTLVSYGQGTGVVVATGELTELGKVSALLARVESLTTRLTQRISEFSQWLTAAILVLTLGTLAFGLLVRDYSFVEIFFAGVALAVAAIPEGLPAIITITLALGVQRMARRHAIIRRLPAVETLGSVTVICSDKTGTLTRNEMTVTTLVTSQGIYQVEGVGYEPRGGFSHEGADVKPEDEPVLQEAARGALLCNDGVLLHKQGHWKVQGDPTDGALIALAMKAGVEREALQRDYPRLDVIPFESEHKFMATLHQNNSEQGVIYLKGAPERVLDVCTRQYHEGQEQPLDDKFWYDKIEDIARMGQRTLALAFKPAGDKRSLEFSDVSSEMIFLGLFGLIDPPREEAVRAVKNCQNAGIRVKMITGDHALTASAIGHQIGLLSDRDAVTGQELEAMDDDQLQVVARKADIFARVSPEHKLRLVKALQESGQVVAMTGDGVNDAPALKRADVGVAMGLNGTEAAKESAEVVLADDNFASIAHAVEEGRTIYDNIRKTLAFILPTNGAQAGIIIASVMMGIELPITPLQILWVNMVTAVTLGLSLAFEKPEGDVMCRPPRSPNAPLIDGFLGWRIVFISTVMVMGTLGLFMWDRVNGASLEVARTAAVNTLIFYQIFYLFNIRYLHQSVLSREGLLGNRVVLGAVGAIIALQMFFTYKPSFQALFGTTSLPVGDWVRLLVLTVSIFALVEVEKKIMKRVRKQEAIRECLKSPD